MLGGVHMPPYVWMPHMFGHPQCPICSNTPICPQCSPAHLYVLGVSTCNRGCGAILMFGHPHVFGCLPMCPTPPCIYMLPCMSVCSRGYCMHYGGNIPYVGGLGAFSTTVRLLVPVSTSIGCPLCFILYLSCSSLCLKSLLPPLSLLLLQ